MRLLIGFLAMLLLASAVGTVLAIAVGAMQAQLQAWVGGLPWFWPTLAGLLGCAVVALPVAWRTGVRREDLSVYLRGGIVLTLVGVGLAPMQMGMLELGFGPTEPPPGSLVAALSGLIGPLAIAIALLGAATLALAPLALTIVKLRERRGFRGTR